jgi:iron complex outermembrane receptor protein
MSRLATYLAISLAPWSIGQAEVPANPDGGVMPRVEVVGVQEPYSTTAPPKELAEQQKVQVPGSLTIRDTEDFQRGRASGFADLLQGIPGVMVQGESSAEAGEISIRGSGILADLEPIGLQFLADGFTMNQGDGEVILEDFDLASIQYAEVFRGANAFRYGGTTLGGAINLVSRTGYDSSPIALRLDAGSYGFFRGHASSGWVDGPADVYAALGARRLDGYRPHSREETDNLTTSLGWKLSDRWENRTYFYYSRTDRLLPGGMTKDQLETNPRQANEDAVEQNLGKAWDYTRVADKVTFNNGIEQFTAGVYWWHRNLEQRNLFGEDSPEGIRAYYADNAGLLFDSQTKLELFHRDNRLTVGFSPNVEREVGQNFQNLDGQRGTLTAAGKLKSINLPFYLQDQQYLSDQLSVVAGLQALYVSRNFQDDFGPSHGEDESAGSVYRGLNPKIGVIYEVQPGSQLFANWSRSWQPPSFDNLLRFEDEAGSSLEFNPLSPQHAWTVETGYRGEQGRWRWELALYRSWVRNELLRVNNLEGQSLGAVNIPRSVHQGIEAGLEVEVLDSVFIRRDVQASTDHLILAQSYTLTDLRFDGDPVYGNNRIAVIPVHLYEARLTYETPRGFYLGPNLRWNITRYPVDHANTLYADAWALLGFRAGYRVGKGFAVYVEARNLTDKRYASDVEAIPDARVAGGEDTQIFHPGDGRSYFGGISWTW